MFAIESGPGDATVIDPRDCNSGDVEVLEPNGNAFVQLALCGGLFGLCEGGERDNGQCDEGECARADSGQP